MYTKTQEMASCALPNLSTLTLREGEEEEEDPTGVGNFELKRLQGAIDKSKGKVKRRLRVPPSEELSLVKRNQQAAELQRARSSLVKAVEKLFGQVNPTRLSQGRDQQERLFNYSTIVPVGVWEIVYGGTNTALLGYRDERERLRVDERSCAQYGTPRECVRTDAAFAYYMQDDLANDLPPLDEALNEKLLLHGTTPERVMNIISGNFQVGHGGGAGNAFGPGVYQAEDAGKADQYARSDGYEVLNRELGLPPGSDMAVAMGSSRPNTYYMLVSRTLLGCANHVSHMQMNRRVEQIQDMKSMLIYGKSPTGGMGLRHPYNSLIKEHGGTLRGGYYTGDKYREFLVQRASQILPVMLVAYMRVWKPEKDLPRFDPKVLGCDRFAGLLDVLHRKPTLDPATGNPDGAHVDAVAHALMQLFEQMWEREFFTLDEHRQIVAAGGVAAVMSQLRIESSKGVPMFVLVPVRAAAAKVLRLMLQNGDKWGDLSVHRELVANYGHFELLRVIVSETGDKMSYGPDVSVSKVYAFDALKVLTRVDDQRLAIELLSMPVPKDPRPSPIPRALLQALAQPLIDPVDFKPQFKIGIPEELDWMDWYLEMKPESLYFDLHKYAGELLFNLLRTLMHPALEDQRHAFVAQLVQLGVGVLCHRLITHPYNVSPDRTTPNRNSLDRYDVTIGVWLLYALEHAQGVRPADPNSIEGQAWEHGLLRLLLDVYRGHRGGPSLEDAVKNKAGQLLHKYLAGGRKATKIIKAILVKAYGDAGIQNPEEFVQPILDKLPAFEREYEHITDAIPTFWN